MTHAPTHPDEHDVPRCEVHADSLVVPCPNPADATDVVAGRSRRVCRAHLRGRAAAASAACALLPVAG